MSAADQEALRLRDRALLDYANTKPCIIAYAGKIAALTNATDLMDVLRTAAEMILAAEDAQDTLKAHASCIRAAMAEFMVEQGISLGLSGHTVSATQGKRQVIISDESRIPAEMLNKPTPNREKIRAALAKGAVPGAELGNGGAPYLTFHKRKELAA